MRLKASLKMGTKGLCSRSMSCRAPKTAGSRFGFLPCLTSFSRAASQIELGILRALVWRRQKSATPMVHGTMEFEHRGTTTATHESMINISPQRCEKQGHIVLSNVTMKFHGLRLITLQEAPQGLGWWFKLWKLNLPRQTAFPKPGIGHRRNSKALSHPMKSPTVRAFDVHRPKIMRRHICLNNGQPCKRQ